MTIIACDCSIDVDEPCRCEQTKEVRARKPHQCCECHETIRPGTRYRVDSGIDYDGVSFRLKTCLPCARIRRWYCPNGANIGGLADQLLECLGFDYRSVPDPEDAEEIDAEDAERVAEHRERLEVQPQLKQQLEEV